MRKNESGFVVFEGLLILVLLGFLMEGTLAFYQRFESALWTLVPS